MKVMERCVKVMMGWCEKVKGGGCGGEVKGGGVKGVCEWCVKGIGCLICIL